MNTKDAELGQLELQIADLISIVLWCQRRLPEELRPYVDRMLAGEPKDPNMHNKDAGDE